MLMPGDSPPGPRRRWRRAAFFGGLVGALLALAVQLYDVVFGDNFHPLVPGWFYRSSQLGDAELERVVRRHGIRTVVNLRGICLGCDWYEGECRATHRCNVAQEDIGLSAGRLPPVSELRQLLRVLDQSEYPILVHCRQGIDRTGLVSALFLLLYTDADLREARREMSLRYGHVPLGRTGYMTRFFALYEKWLERNGLEHAPAVIRRWLKDGYSPGPALARLEVIEAPTQVPVGCPFSVRVRAHNLSAETWHFRPGNNAGVHLGYILSYDRARHSQRGRAGLFVANVEPGHSIELTLAVPPVPVPGPCFLMVDMLDEQQISWFYQSGSEPLQLEFTAE